MRVTEDDEVGLGKLAAKSREPALLRSRVVDHANPQAGQIEFGGFTGSPCTDIGAVIVAHDGMHGRVRRQLLEHACHADIAGVQDHLSRAEVFGHRRRAALPESGGVRVGEDHDAHRLIVPGSSRPAAVGVVGVMKQQEQSLQHDCRTGAARARILAAA